MCVAGWMKPRPWLPRCVYLLGPGGADGGPVQAQREARDAEAREGALRRQWEAQEAQLRTREFDADQEVGSRAGAGWQALLHAPYPPPCMRWGVEQGQSR